MRHLAPPPGKAPGFDFQFSALADGRVNITVQFLADDGSYLECHATATADSMPGLRQVAANINKACDDAETAGKAVAARGTEVQP